MTRLTLGTVTYSQAQLLAIFNTPVRGNGLISLAHQLIAAKLNILAGANGGALSSCGRDSSAVSEGAARHEAARVEWPT